MPKQELAPKEKLPVPPQLPCPAKLQPLKILLGTQSNRAQNLSNQIYNSLQLGFQNKSNLLIQFQ